MHFLKLLLHILKAEHNFLRQKSMGDVSETPPVNFNLAIKEQNLPAIFFGPHGKVYPIAPIPVLLNKELVKILLSLFRIAYKYSRILYCLVNTATADIHSATCQVIARTDDGGYYLVYDENGKKINTLSKMTVGKVISVSGATFTSEDGGWIKIYDRKGKKITTKSK